MAREAWNKRRSVSLKHCNILHVEEPPITKKRYTNSTETEYVKPAKRTLSGPNAFSIVHSKGFRKEKEKSKKILAKFFGKKKKQTKVVPTNDHPSKDIKLLYGFFPTFPKKMMTCLYCKNEGNSSVVLTELVSRGWRPNGLKRKKKPFKDESNKHFTVPYYFGPDPGKSELKKLFRNVVAGSFITFYRTYDTDKSYSYILCSKKKTGRLVERKVAIFEIPPILFCQAKLTEPIVNPFRRSISYIPGHSC